MKIISFPTTVNKCHKIGDSRAYPKFQTHPNIIFLRHTSHEMPKKNNALFLMLKPLPFSVYAIFIACPFSKRVKDPICPERLLK